MVICNSLARKEALYEEGPTRYIHFVCVFVCLMHKIIAICIQIFLF